jgi:hypothetical protein
LTKSRNEVDAINLFDRHSALVLNEGANPLSQAILVEAGVDLPATPAEPLQKRPEESGRFCGDEHEPPLPLGDTHRTFVGEEFFKRAPWAESNCAAGKRHIVIPRVVPTRSWVDAGEALAASFAPIEKCLRASKGSPRPETNLSGWAVTFFGRCFRSEYKKAAPGQQDKRNQHTQNAPCFQLKTQRNLLLDQDYLNKQNA